MTECRGGSFIPLRVGRVDSGERVSPTEEILHWHQTRFANGHLNFPNPEVGGASGFRFLLELYFSGNENVAEFLKVVENNVKFLEMPSNMACAYLKGHLLDRAKDWYKNFGSTLVQDLATDFAQFKEALTKNFPVVWNRNDLEVKFYSAHQSRGQKSTDFIYDFLNVHKKLGLKMFEEALVEHIFARLEPLV
ncbi:uncharacterized protein TNCV_869071 [Trichonephila clavipes]|nr:uncharacterized protein TNCV_869071 [Trichonephila clavipes]